jgi:hypothetical protein
LIKRRRGLGSWPPRVDLNAHVFRAHARPIVSIEDGPTPEPSARRFHHWLALRSRPGLAAGAASIFTQPEA